MAKDPAFLFYPGDWLGGTMGFSFEIKGCYFELLVYQFNNGGKFTEAQAKQVLNSSFDVAWPLLKQKFRKDGDSYFSQRLNEEIERRKKFTESRRINGLQPKTIIKDIEASAKDMEAVNENRIVLEEIGSEKVKLIANEVWKDQIWKEQICLGLSVSMEELKKWLAQFNSSIASDKIPGFDKGKYKKMSRGWISTQKVKGVTVESGSLVKKSDSAPLKLLPQHGF